MLPVLGGMLLLLDQHAHARFGRLFASGVLFGLAVVMKQPGIFFALFAVIYLMTKEIRSGLRPKEWFVRALVFSGGVILPLDDDVSVLALRRCVQRVLVLDGRLRATVWHSSSPRRRSPVFVAPRE